MLHRRIHFGLIVRVCVLLLIGAVITVAAAWAVAVWFAFLHWGTMQRSTPTSEEVRWWKATVTPGIDDAPTATSRPGASVTEFGFDCVRMESNAQGASLQAYRWRGGLPLRSMGYYTWSDNPDPDDPSVWHSSWRWDVTMVLRGESRLVNFPLTPLWFGFVVDTLFYAALAAVILAAWRWMVRRGRLKRGLCPACRYPIGRSAVCSECGEGLVVRTDRSGGVPSQE